MPKSNALTILIRLARAIPFTSDSTEDGYWCALCDASEFEGFYANDVDNPLYDPKNHKPLCPWHLATELLDSKGIIWRTHE